MNVAQNLRRNSIFDQFDISGSGIGGFDIGGDGGNTSPTYNEPEDPRMVEAMRSSEQANRMAQINAPDASTDPNDFMGPDAIAALINKIYSPETQATKRYNDLLDNIPQMQKPGILRTLAASAAGFAHGGDAAAKIQYEPYIRDITAWKDKATPFQQAATLENQSNNIERQLAGQAVTGYVADRRAATTAKTAADKLAESERAAKAREAETNRNHLSQEAVARNKLLLGQTLATQANYKPMETTEGIVLVDTKTGQMKNTGLQSSDFSDMEKLAYGFITAATLKGIPQAKEDTPNSPKEIQQIQSMWLQEQARNPRYKDLIRVAQDGTSTLKSEPSLTGMFGTSIGASTQDQVDAYRELVEGLNKIQAPLTNPSVRQPTMPQMPTMPGRQPSASTPPIPEAAAPSAPRGSGPSNFNMLPSTPLPTTAPPFQGRSMNPPAARPQMGGPMASQIQGGVPQPQSDQLDAAGIANGTLLVATRLNDGKKIIIPAHDQRAIDWAMNQGFMVAGGQ